MFRGYLYDKLLFWDVLGYPDKFRGFVQVLGCANKDLWAFCAPIFIIVVYCKTATSYFFGDKE